MKSKLSITINQKTLKIVDSLIDNLYIRNRSQAMEHLVEKALGENKTAVILAGGYEKNLKISKEEYRPTAKIGNSTIIELALKKLRESGFRNLFIVAKPIILKDIFQIIGDGSKYRVALNYVEEGLEKGSADSLRLLKGRIKSPFLVVYSDIIFNQININNLWSAHLKQKAISTLMIESSLFDWEKAGVVKIEGNKIIEFIQRPPPKKIGSYIFFSGIFVTEPEIFEYHGASLEYDVFPLLAQKGFLNSYLNSAPYFHFHTKEELKKMEPEIKQL